MQITGSQFTNTAAVLGNDLATFPDFPAEIRAPVQAPCPACPGFQVHFSSTEIYTPGDQPDVLVAMNPAALKVNVKDLPQQRDRDHRHGRVRPTRNLKKAEFESNPLEDGSLAGLPRRSRCRSRRAPRPRSIRVRGADGQGEASLQELLRARDDLLAVQPADFETTIRVAREEVRQEAGDRRGQHHWRSRRASRVLRRERGSSSTHLRGRAGAKRAGHLPQHDRATRRPGARARRGEPPQRGVPLFLRLVSDHAGEQHPARAGEATRTSAW